MKAQEHSGLAEDIYELLTNNEYDDWHELAIAVAEEVEKQCEISIGRRGEKK